MGAERLKIVRIHLLRQPGYETADKTATAVEAIRLGILPIHFLQLPGYETVDETAKLSLPMSTLLVGTYDNIVGASIARPLLCLGRQSVTVLAHLNPLPLLVALCPSRRASGFPLRGSC